MIGVLLFALMAAALAWASLKMAPRDAFGATLLAIGSILFAVTFVAQLTRTPL